MSTKIVGHRGAALLEPENTLVSFERAIADGADLLECDVHLSADGEIVVIHDGTIDRTAAETSPRRTGAVSSLSREELDQVELDGGHRIPSLDAVLDVTVAAGVPLKIEIKAVAAAEPVARLLIDRGLDGARAEAADGADGVGGNPLAIALSFQYEALEQIRALCPQVPVSVIAKSPDEEFWAFTVRIGAYGVAMNIAEVRAHDVERAHAAGYQVNVWTLNDVDPVLRALELGADTLTTDDPAWARGVMTTPVAV